MLRKVTADLEKLTSREIKIKYFMNKNFLTKTLILFFLSGSVIQCFSQSSPVNYRRSSLTRVLVESDGLGKDRDLVIKAYNANPLPDKYNTHKTKDKEFNVNTMKLTTQDYLDAGFYKDTLKTIKDFLGAAKKPLNPLRYLGKDSTKAVQEPNKQELLNIYISKYIKDKKIAKQLVSSWYNRSNDGRMDYELLKERAAYTARVDETTGGDSKQALEDKLIKDIDIVKNTFVVFNNMEFYENEPAARLIRDLAKKETMKKLAGKPQMLIDKAFLGIDNVYNKTKEGYTVKCNTYLYQLNWDEDVAKKTKDWFITGDSTLRTKIWDSTNLYKLNFVGKTISSSIVVGGKKSLQEIIDLQVNRTLDNAMSKLQKEYVVFRPVTPMASVNPITAYIGTKEGVEPGQTYELLKSVDDKFGIPHWESAGKVKVNKNLQIFDNVIGAEPKLDDKGNVIEGSKFTTFDGGKKASQFWYLRLVK
jgi:hypothetical protein